MQEGMVLFTVRLSVLFLGDFLSSKNKFFKFLDLFPINGAGIGILVSMGRKDDSLMADSCVLLVQVSLKKMLSKDAFM